MLCALSGEEAKEPVVSPRSGAIFDRSLIETYLSTAGKDPINDEPLTVEELITIASPPAIAPPKPPSYNSIPTMLAAFQNEWDALALETFTLRKQLHAAREELSAALYQYDAAVRVAARATKERDQAQQALRQLLETFATAETVALKPEETDGLENGRSTRQLPADELTAARAALFALHKTQKVSLPVTKASRAAIATTSEPTNVNGVVRSAYDEQFLLGTAEFAKVFPDGPEVAGSYALAFLHREGQAVPIGVGNDKLVKLLDNTSVPFALDVSLLAAHPTLPYFVAVAGKQWHLCDENGILHSSEELDSISAAEIHVDGVLLGVASGNKVDIFDLTTGQQVSTVEAQGPVTSLQFALNGYWLVLGVADAVEVHDLRKNVLVRSIAVGPDARFVLDASCQVLATHLGDKLQVHLYGKKGKTWVENAGEIATEKLSALHMVLTVEDVQSSGTVRLAGVGEGDIYYYEVLL